MPSIGNDGHLSFLLQLTSILFFLPGVWNGFACLSNPCLHGVCLDDLNTTYSCYCIDGYTGVQCQTNWDECWSSPCQNGGVCIDGIAMFNCSCPPGFVGDLCEEDFNECESNPCINNGTCLDATNGYTCNCLPGYSGIHCEIDVAVCNATNETRCANGGICVEGPGDTFTCRCQPGWGGFLCDSEINECMSAPCRNGAVCIDLHADYACACLFGYSGKNCDESVAMCESNPCRNGALCLVEESHFVCYCVPDYHGDLCQYQYDECQLGPRCMNGGTCIDGIDNFTCSCPSNLTGVLCECLIIGDNDFDCTYISPTPKTPSSTSTTTERSTASTSTTTERSTASTSSTTTERSTTSISTPTESSTISTTTEPTTTTTTTIIPITETESTTEIITTVPNIFTNASTESTTIAVLTNTTLDTTISTEFITTTTSEPPSTTTIFTETSTPIITTADLTTITHTESSITAEIPITANKTTEATPSTTKELPTTVPDIITFSTESTTFSTDLTTFSFYPTTTGITQSTFTNLISTSSEVTYSSTMTSLITVSPTGRETNLTVSTETTPSTSTTSFMTDEPKTTSEELETTRFTLPELPITTEPTHEVSIDCTKSGTRCRNGGTCIYYQKGYKCLCPFDTDGILCEINLGIRKAAFNGDSYLSHRLTNISDIKLEFKAKTVTSNGLIFYSSVDMTYMALYIENGYLKFKFSCGYQTMLLSELKVPINNGYDMNIEAHLVFSKDFKHCDAAIRVNNSLSMAGDQMASLSKFVKPVAWLHLGGIPQEYITENIPNVGFVGCMTDLKISGIKINIFKDAEDGMEVTECSSLACLSSPCSNGATCISKGDEWHCSCKNGYLGKLCEISVCTTNPCLYGGTCVPFSGSGYICLCRYGKHGHFCEHDLKITEPNFSSTIHGLSSFAAYPIPDGISRTMELSFKFAPTSMEQIAILMFIGQKGKHDVHSDHMAISFVKGYIMLTWNLGSGPRRIFTNQPIPKGQKEYMVKIGHIGRRAWLFVENIGNVTGRSPGPLIQLDVLPLLYLGGHESLNFSTLPHDLPLHSGFSGCIYDVQLKFGSVLIPLKGNRDAFGRGVSQCGTTECYEQRCQNGGACLHHGSTFMCLCQDRWFGPLCTSRFNPCDNMMHRCKEGSTCVPLVMGYACDCPFGKTGEYCEKEENITDISLSGKRSFIAIHFVEMEITRFDIEMDIRPLSNDGLLLFLGRKEYCFLALTLQSGFLELKIVTGKKAGNMDLPVTLTSNKLLVIGSWHKIIIGIFGRKVYLSVDNVISTGLLNAGSALSVSKDNIFLGGLPDLSNLPPLASSSLPTSYTGCIRLFSLNSKHIPLIKENVQNGRNVMDCDGTPCGGDACENGGTCWIDSNMLPHCLCPQPYYGIRCEILPVCKDSHCQHYGRCHDSSCSCNMGWNGVFCENEIVVKTPEFTGKSYLIVKKTGEKKRDTSRVDLKNVYLNFTTAKPNGLLIWSRQGKSFIGIGLEKGFLKIAYSIGKFNKEYIEIPSSEDVSDGLWHNIQLNFAPMELVLDGNSLKVQNKSDGSLDYNTTIRTNGIFYVGGLPTNSSLFTETFGIFPHAFEGCVEAFGTNTESVITDFNNFEGNNVDVCHVL